MNSPIVRYLILFAMLGLLLGNIAGDLVTRQYACAGAGMTASALGFTLGAWFMASASSGDEVDADELDVDGEEV